MEINNKNEEIFISVIIPVFNVENRIYDTLVSVLSQKYTNYEIIIINDGSTDKTLNIINKIAINNSNMFIYSTNNKGVSSARNLGIEKSKGKYLFFLDGDDIISKNLLSQANDYLKVNKVDIYSFGYEKIGINKTKKYISKTNSNKEFYGIDFLSKFLNREISQSICSVVISKDLIINNDLKFNETTKNGEDTEFLIKVNFYAEKIFYTSEIMFYYILREESASQGPFIRDNFDVYNRIDRFLESNNIKNRENYKANRFFSFLKNILMHGTNKNTLNGFIEEIEISKIPVGSGCVKNILFKFYKLFLRRYLLLKYK